MFGFKNKLYSTFKTTEQEKTTTTTKTNKLTKKQQTEARKLDFGNFKLILHFLKVIQVRIWKRPSELLYLHHRSSAGCSTIWNCQLGCKPYLPFSCIKPIFISICVRQSLLRKDQELINKV